MWSGSGNFLMFDWISLLRRVVVTVVSVVVVVVDVFIYTVTFALVSFFDGCRGWVPFPAFSVPLPFLSSLSSSSSFSSSLSSSFLLLAPSSFWGFGVPAGWGFGAPAGLFFGTYFFDRDYECSNFFVALDWSSKELGCIFGFVKLRWICSYLSMKDKDLASRWLKLLRVEFPFSWLVEFT